MDNPPIARVSFISHLSSDDGAKLRGGVLTVDLQSKPVEFRCTTPIRPTQVQKLLFGKALLPHITIELIAIPLIHALKEKPSIILVNDPLFLAVGERSEIALACIRKQGETLHLASGESNMSDGIVVNSKSGRFAPVIASFSNARTIDKEKLVQLLQDYHEMADILEPFERISNALKEIDRQKTFEG